LLEGPICHKCWCNHRHHPMRYHHHHHPQVETRVEQLRLFITSATMLNVACIILFLIVVRFPN
jgi:hypothetical protein